MRRKWFDTIPLFEVLIAVMLVIVFGALIWVLIWVTADRVLHREELVLEVIDKWSEVSSNTQCDSDGRCTTTKTTHYHALTADDMELSVTSRNVYSQLRVGKRHHVVIRGRQFPVIVEVLE
jgi:hypothetical protein